MNHQALAISSHTNGPDDKEDETMTATITALHSGQSTVDQSGQVPGQTTVDAVARDRRKGASQAGGDLLAAARFLFTAVETYRRKAGDDDMAARVSRVRADLMAVMAGKDTPTEIEYGDLAADASAYADEVEKLREELESVRGPRVHGKGN
jgi:hypothetical protein